MKKKIINIVIIFVLSITMISPMNVTTYASTSPAKITSDIVSQRISQLQTLCGMGFTINGELCYKVDHAAIYCSNCNVKNVLQKNAKVRNLIKKYKGGYSPSPISNLPYHMIDASGSTSSYGDSCFGFASFAGWYIFASKYTDKVVFSSVKTNLNYNYSNVKKYVKPGDIVRFENKHSAIVISVGSKGVKVLHANWPSTTALKNSSRVSVDSISYTTYSKIGISRATNYSSNSTLTVKAKNIESTGKPCIYWTAHTGASKYKVYSKRKSSSTYTYRGYTTKTSFTDTTAVPSYSYTYKVQAIDSKGNLLKTDYVSRSCALAKPEMTGITNVESTGAIKGYFKGVKYANKYKVYRSTSKNGPYSFVFSLSTEMCKGGESLRFINTSTTPGKTYYYKIQAVNTNNTEADSVLSGYMYRTRDLAMPSVKVTGDSYGRNVLSWSAISGADQYEVYRSTNGSDYTRIYRGTSIKVTNTKNLVNGTKYYYKVRAVDNSNSYANSAYSDPVSRTYSK